MPSSPTARRYELARRLRQLRTDARRTPEEVAEELVCSLPKITRMENGQRIATPLDIKVLAQFYGLSASVRDELAALAADARKRGWWQDYRSLDEQTQTYLGLESAASRLDSVSVILLPGILQVASYTRSVVPRLRTPDAWSPERIEQVVLTRDLRRRRLLDGSLHVRCIVDEAALARRIGTPELRVEQVTHLIEMADRDNVELQVVTLDVGAHPGLEGAFTLLSFPGGEPSDVVYIEHMANSSILHDDERSDTVQQFRAVHEHMRTRDALSVDDTRTWLHQFHRQLNSGVGPTATT